MGRAVVAVVRVGALDDTDNDPIVLLTYVATAVDRVAPIDARVFEALTSPGASVEGTIVPRLGAALVAADEPLVLVLDDLHLLHDRGCLDAVATLAQHVRDGPWPGGDHHRASGADG